MSDAAVDADLDRRQKEAEIRKTEAEAAALSKPQGFFHANWVAIVTTVATLLTALGGSSALISALAALRTADQTLQYRESIVAANEKLILAKQDSLSVQERKDEMMKETEALTNRKTELDNRNTELKHEQAALDAGNTVLAKQQAELTQNIEAERTKGIVYSSELKVYIASQQNALSQLAKRMADAKVQLQNAAKVAPSTTTKTALEHAATGISAPQQATSGRLVYLEYLDKATGGAMTGLQAELQKQGFTAPGVQQVDFRHIDVLQPDEVRYFRPEDKVLAQQVAGIANAYFATACGSRPKISPRKHSTSAPTTQLEVWTAFSCKKV